MNDSKNNIVTKFKNTGLFSEIDIHFAGFIARFSADWNAELFLAAALVSRATANGDICLNLDAAIDVFEKWDSPDVPFCPSPDRWRETLFLTPAVGQPGDRCPLILDERNRLYLYRYWNYEKALSDFIKERIKGELTEIDARALDPTIKKLFSEDEDQKVNWQKLAAVIAVLKRFSIITGGPGSGKTYTIHRLLKPMTGTPYFRRNTENPLPADIVVIDEASMVDLALMSKLVQAVAPHARLLRPCMSIFQANPVNSNDFQPIDFPGMKQSMP